MTKSDCNEGVLSSLVSNEREHVHAAWSRGTTNKIYICDHLAYVTFAYRKTLKLCNCRFLHSVKLEKQQSSMVCMVKTSTGYLFRSLSFIYLIIQLIISPYSMHWAKYCVFLSHLPQMSEIYQGWSHQLGGT